MGVVVSDTGPINYLLVIGRIELLPTLFGAIAIPAAVHGELLNPAAPETVRTWASQPPGWVALHASTPGDALTGRRLGAGESAAIALAQQLRAGLLLSDDRAAIAAARSQRLVATGTIGVLIRAARRGIVDLEAALADLEKTSFRRSAALFATVLAAEGRR